MDNVDLSEVGKEQNIPKIFLTAEQAEQLGMYKDNKFTVVVDGKFEDNNQQIGGGV